LYHIYNEFITKNNFVEGFENWGYSRTFLASAFRDHFEGFKIYEKSLTEF